MNFSIKSILSCNAFRANGGLLFPMPNIPLGTKCSPGERLGMARGLLASWLGGRGVGRERVDNLAGLGVVQLLAGFEFDGVGIGFEFLDALAQARILLLETVDLLAQLLVFQALLLPDG